MLLGLIIIISFIIIHLFLYATSCIGHFTPGKAGFYSRVLSLCRALSQYLLSISKLPSSFHIPADKEHLITAFTCTAIEVNGRVKLIHVESLLSDKSNMQISCITFLILLHHSTQNIFFIQVVVCHLLQDHLPLSVDLQWALSCLCLALQQSCIWNKLASPDYNTHTCSLIYCLHLIIVAGQEASDKFMHNGA